MSNSFQSVTSGVGVLKRVYRGPLVDALNGECPIYRAAEKVKDAYSGEVVRRPVRVRRNQGIGATSDGGNLPSIGRQTTVQAEIAAKYNYLRFGITGPMIKASQNDIGSFVRGQAYELEMGYKDLKSDLNRQLSWDGTGDLAKLNAAANASNSITIEGRESSEPALKFVDVGLVFDIYTSGGTLVASSITVSAISSGTPSSSTAVLTLDQNITASAGDILVRAGSFGYEMQGLLAALDGGTSSIYGIDRSTYLSYQGNIVDMNGAQLSLDKMQEAFNEGLRRGNIGKFNAVWTDFASLRYYQKLLTPDKRYSNTQEGDGTFGNKGQFYLNFNGIPVVADKDCPTRMFFLPAEVLKNYVLCEMEFADETSASGLIAQNDADSFEVRVRQFANLFNEQPAACGVVTDYISP